MTTPPVIDARDLLCPLPVLRLRKALLDVPVGNRLTLLTTDPMAAVDVPHFCRAAGHVILDQRALDARVTEFTVERGLSAPPDASGLTPGDI